LTHDDVAAPTNALEVAFAEVALEMHPWETSRTVSHTTGQWIRALNRDLDETNDFIHQAYAMLPFDGSRTLGMLLVKFRRALSEDHLTRVVFCPRDRQVRVFAGIW
jgi:hypothetical protein